MHRPRIYTHGGKWYRSPNSPLLTRRTLLNPRHRRRYRCNPPIKQLLSKQLLMSGVKIGGGIALGFALIPVMYNIIPAANRDQFSKWLGALNVLLGGLMIGFIRNKTAKDMGVVVAGTGVYDLLSQNVEMLKLPAIPRVGGLLSSLMPAAQPQAGYADLPYVGASYGVPVAPISPAAKAGIGASYEAPDSRIAGFGSDNPYADIDGFEGF
jgi:hypothetical protein